jgi:hypothetical protein
VSPSPRRSPGSGTSQDRRLSADAVFRPSEFSSAWSESNPLVHRTLSHRFVEMIPDRLEPAVLYISTTYGTAVHTCCCGCGEEVVTPLTPTDWAITFDGESVSLWPSVGNWNAACRSHYIVRRGRVLTAEPWTEAEVAAERRRDQASKARYFAERDTADGDDPPAAAALTTEPLVEESALTISPAESRSSHVARLDQAPDHVDSDEGGSARSEAPASRRSDARPIAPAAVVSATTAPTATPTGATGRGARRRRREQKRADETRHDGADSSTDRGPAVVQQPPRQE